ncbi:MAG TPA: prepilin-type N-terminal cleavage/methylation domain-containing protein [Pyrinomonadaceae bacterium]|nr:prepilin-type N-terminal cleavage/methylation domain-containing protein [Pyrinomonadaceae bacterium]
MSGEWRGQAARRLQRGFTLLELMIVISILVILAMIAVAQYNKTVQAAREATLRDNIYQLNKMVDQYAADKGKLPQSLEELVSAGYIQDLPVDPITGERNWNTEFGDDPGSTESSQGIVRVRSLSNDLSSDGETRYSEW